MTKLLCINIYAYALLKTFHRKVYIQYNAMKDEVCYLKKLSCKAFYQIPVDLMLKNSSLSLSLLINPTRSILNHTQMTCFQFLR